MVVGPFPTFLQTSANAYINYAMSLSPLGIWMLDEIAGTNAADSSGNGRAGTYNGSYTQGQASLLPSGYGKSTNFPQTSPQSKVTVPYPATFALTTAGTLNAFIKMDSLSGSFGCSIANIEFNGGFKNGYMLYCQDSLPKFIVYDNLSGSGYNADTSITLAGHMLTVIWDGANSTIYIDGVAHGNTAGLGTCGASASNLVLGCNSDDLDDIALKGDEEGAIVFNYALNTTQIENLYIAAGGTI